LCPWIDEEEEDDDQRMKLKGTHSSCTQNKLRERGRERKR